MNLIKPPSSICFSLVDQVDDDCSEITMAAFARVMTAEQQKIFELKQQLVKQQDMISDLQARIGQCQIEKAELEAENAVLIEERTDQQIMTADAKHAKLMRENARLQVVSNIMRKTFKKSSEEAKRMSNVDKQTIMALEHQNLMLREKVQKCLGVQKTQQHEYQRPPSDEKPCQEFLYKPGVPQGEFQESLHRKLSKETEESKSNTAPTLLLSESSRTYTELSKNFTGLDKTLPMKSVNIGATNNEIIEDIDSEELKYVAPWLECAVTARSPMPRAA